MPEALRIASIDDGVSGWFFGEKASIDGGMIADARAVQALPDERRAGEHDALGLAPRTGAGTPRPRARARSARPRRRGSARRRAHPARAARGTRPAVCGSCSITTSPARPARASSRGVPRAASPRRCARSASRAARRRPATPCRHVVEALGDSKKAGVPVDHDPARVDAGAARVRQERGQQLRDSAATAVELTFQMIRPANASRARRAAPSSRSHWSSSSTVRKRSSDAAPVSTSRITAGALMTEPPVPGSPRGV